MTQMKEQSKSNDIKVPNDTKEKPAWIRLEDQMNWYDHKSCHCQKWYKRLKLVQIILAISIPILSHLPNGWATWLTSIAGGLIAVIEAMQHLNQYSTLWITYRSTAERLKHEKYLFLSEAGPYANLEDAVRFITLSERVEEHVSTEHANWFKEIQNTARARKGESA
jgi:hypothetical protein